MGYGRYLDELETGQQFRHWPGRTITEFDDTLFSLMSMNQHPLHIDEHFHELMRRRYADEIIILKRCFHEHLCLR